MQAYITALASAWLAEAPKRRDGGRVGIARGMLLILTVRHF